MRAVEASVSAGVEAQKANAAISVSRAQTLSSHITNTAQVLTQHDHLAASASKGMFDFYSQRIMALSQQLSGIVAEIQNA
jgi:hypothetical protein